MKDSPITNVYNDVERINLVGIMEKHNFTRSDLDTFLICCSRFVARGHALVCIEVVKKAFEHYGFTVVMGGDGINWRIS